MAYEKRVCVLRQVRKGFSADGSALTGAVYAERLGEQLTITPRIAALSPLRDGRYALFVWADGKTYCLELRGGASIRIENAPSIAAGFAVLLCFMKGEPEPIAFGRCGAAPERYSVLLEENTGRKRAIPVPLSPVQTPAPAPNVPLAPAVPLPEPIPDDDRPSDGVQTGASPQRERAAARYDDEAIAASDYFARTGDGDEKTAASAEGQGAEAVPNAGDLLLRPRGSLTYYYTVKEKLDAFFARGERDERLRAVYPHSEWVKEGKALVGIVYEDGVPRWLCVAVEGERPAVFGERAVFVPYSPFDEEKGAWVVFQDADTGEYVRLREA